ncbi:MAG: cytochrome c3 family protein [Desulfatiglandaceae bacterium]
MNRGVSALLASSLITGMLVVGQIVGVDAQTQQAKKSAGSQDLDIIMIDNEGYKKDRRGPVAFSHKKHAREYKILCWECHHEYESDENIWAPWGATKKCSQCHDPLIQEQNEIKLQTAYHLNCKGCHMSLAKADQKAGAFRKCNGCHVKK